MTIPRHDIDLIAAISKNLHRVFTNHDLRLIHRRLDGWDSGGYPGTGSGGPTSVGEHSDPTARQALAPTGVDYRRAVADAKRAMLILEAVLAEATRSPHASKAELTATFIGAAARPGSGTCEACDKSCPGRPGPAISTKSGRALCRAHDEGFRRKRALGWNVADYVRSTRAMLGADLEQPA